MTGTSDRAPLCRAADPNPRPPRTSFPAGACDTHAHICGPADLYPYSPDRVYTPPDATLGQYLALLRALGCTRAVLVQPSVYQSDNTALLNSLREVGNGLRGVAVVSPSVSKDDVAAMHEAGVRGLRLNLVDRHGERNIVPRDLVRDLVRLVADYGWHLEFLVNLDEGGEFAETVAGLPVDIVLGHLGYPKSGAGDWPRQAAFERLLRLLDGGRCWVKLTGPYRISKEADIPYADVTHAARRLVEHTPERLLWGTDWPHVMFKKERMPNDGELADLVELWIPSASARQTILVDNPERLYGFAAGESLPG